MALPALVIFDMGGVPGLLHPDVRRAAKGALAGLKAGDVQCMNAGHRGCRRHGRALLRWLT